MKRRLVLGIVVALLLAPAAFGTGVSEELRGREPINAGVETETPPTAIERIQARFPVYQAAVLFKMAGNEMQGVYMLAEYDSAPEAIYVKYENTGVGTRHFREFQYVTVYSPNGDTVLFYDFSDVLPEFGREIILHIPEIDSEESGIWRVSFIGGQHGDRVEIGLPATDNWGIGGIAKLGVTETTPTDLYAYLPESVAAFRVYTYPFTNEQEDVVDVSVYKPNGELYAGPDDFAVAVTNGFAVRRTLKIEPGVALGGGEDSTVDVTDTVWRISQNADVGDAIYLPSSPELLTPTPEAARALRGGTFEVGGITVQGPLQRRAREAMLRFDPETDFDVDIEWPEVTREYVDSLENPQLEALMWGYYGGLPHLNYVFDKQVIDPQSPAYGFFVHESGNLVFPEVNWHNFFYPKANNTLHMGNFAALLTVPTETNLTYHNEAVLNRAQLSALAMINNISSVGIIRSIPADAGDGLSGAGFFQFENLAHAYYHLRDLLDPEVKDIYEQAMLFYADHYGNFTHFTPNQVNAVISGYLNLHLATGEPRFLDKFERMTWAYTDYTSTRPDTYQTMNAFGQHPAGYFLEQWGPDGNYENMALALHIQNYYKYRDLPQSDPALVSRMKESLDRAFFFQQFHWLPQPDGELRSPNSINARTVIPLYNSGHPGAHAAYPEFPIAAAKFHLQPQPEPGEPGVAAITNYVATTEEWQRDLIYWGMSGRGDAFEGDPGRVDLTGKWARLAYDAFTLPSRVEPATLPFEMEEGIWELDGQVAFKHGDLYTLVFYSGDPRSQQGRITGAPIALWAEETGSVVLSMRNRITGRPEGTMMQSSLVRYGASDAPAWEGMENGTLRWIELDRVFEIASDVRWAQPVGASIGAVPNTRVVWTYELHDDGRVTIDVEHIGDLGDHQVYLNLPVYLYGTEGEDFTVSGPEGGSLTLSRDGGAVEVSWLADAQVQYGEPVAPNQAAGGQIRSLRIPIDPDDGSVRVVLQHR